ncbi:MAG: Glycerol kinase [uncultured Thermomicrobiales bacterium]|uniref:Glycerol kinase n=1 Tax=uncultured Thermomicrobiales bacterium TaxID=1645740 RepID=A0A6J4UJE1_9BACT|nr:MAG: Glycerol kinase [uncultured Thermomicrobiales bacterium]
MTNRPGSDPGSQGAILALDQGTTSSRAIVYGAEGEVLGSAQRPVTPSYPRSGWVNQDADQLWDTILDVAGKAIHRAGIAVGQLAAIGITNQRETTILWDRHTGQPVAPAISWQSRQTAPLVEAIERRGRSERYHRITGLKPDAYFSATKIATLLEEFPDLRRRAEAGEVVFGTVDSWLLWHLTGGEHRTDITNASRTMLFDIRTRDWSDELLTDLDIPRLMLPEVRASAGNFGAASADLLGAAVPVCGIAGDQHAALFGHACLEPGEAKNTYGTGSFVLMQTGDRPVESGHGLLTTVAWQIDGQPPCYALEGSIFVTGAAVQWLRDGLGLIRQAAEIETLAASVPDSGGVVFVPALTGLGAPDWDPDARGLIIGLSRGTTAGHVARAALEAICFQTRDVIDAMADDAPVPLTELRVDGGAAANDMLLQLQADLLGVPVVRPAVLETTAFGAAALARIGAGLDTAEAHAERTRHRADRRFEPAISADERDSRHARWRRAVDRARGWERDLT